MLDSILFFNGVSDLKTFTYIHILFYYFCNFCLKTEGKILKVYLKVYLKVSLIRIINKSAVFFEAILFYILTHKLPYSNN